MARQITITADTSRAVQIDRDLAEVGQSSAALPVFFAFSRVELSINLRDLSGGAAGAPYEIPSGAAFQFSVAEDFDAATNPLIRVNTPEASAAAGGNFYRIDATNSRVTIFFTADTAELRAYINNLDRAQVYTQLLVTSPDDPVRSILMQSPCEIQGDIDPPSAQSPTPGDANYLTAPETRALVASRLIYNYSIDGTSWHADLRESDVYQRVKHGENGAWSDTQLIPHGHRGPSGHYENGLADVTFTPGGTWSKTAVELGVIGEPPVAVYDNAGYDVTADSRVSVNWNAGTLTVITPADAAGTWRLKFAGGSVNIRERVAAWPVQYLSGRMCHLLDAVNSSLEISDEVRNVAALKFYVRSASAVVGDIVLQLALNGTALKTVVLPVTATETMQTIAFDDPVTGRLVMTALTADARWTLKDTDVVSAVVAQDIYTEVAR